MVTCDSKVMPQTALPHDVVREGVRCWSARVSAKGDLPMISESEFLRPTVGPRFTRINVLPPVAGVSELST